MLQHRKSQREQMVRYFQCRLNDFDEYVQHHHQFERLLIHVEPKKDLLDYQMPIEDEQVQNKNRICQQSHLV